MLEPYTWVTFGLLALSILVGAVTGISQLRWRKAFLLPPALVTLAVLGQLGVTIVLVISQSVPLGGLIMFGIYLVVAIVIALATVVWMFVDRSRFSAYIQVISGLALSVMVSRLFAIWTDHVSSLSP